MSWALIAVSDNRWLSGPLDEEPTPADGQRVVEVALGYPDTCLWSADRGGFVDVIAPSPMISVGRFKLLLTMPERIAIRGAAATDPEVEDFLDLLGGFAEVSLSDPMLIGCINALVSKNLLTAERAAQVLAGQTAPTEQAAS